MGGWVMKGRAARDYEDFFDAYEPVWWKREVRRQNGEIETLWLTRHPGADHHGQLNPAHTITEHDDGAITVSPSIQCQCCGWHGFLEHGVWRQA